MSYAKSVGSVLLISLLGACTPKVGTPEWCKMMKEKPKGDWTVNETKDFLQHCLVEKKDE